MLNLNLIAEEEKQIIKYQRLYSLCLQAEIFLSVIILFCGIIVFSAEKILAANVYQASQQTASLINASSADYNSKAKELNDRMAAVAQIENGFVPYSRIINNVYTLIPATTTLSFLDVDSKAGAIEIRGLSPDRDNLRDLETRLNSASWLTGVNVPLEEKLKKININFDITASFNLKKLP